MNLFLCYLDDAFLQVRANTLQKSSQHKFHIYNLQSGNTKLPDLIVFQRSYSLIHRVLFLLCRIFRIKYIADIDDNVWNLPSYSNDYSLKNSRYLEYLDKLLSNAEAITVSTKPLLDYLKAKYKNKNIVLIENSFTPLQVPSNSIVVANTDSFKLEKESIYWFSEILNSVSKNGNPIVLIGENENLIQNLEPFSFLSYNKLTYSSYQELLSTSNLLLALVPVAESLYADCKSDIKIQEFLSFNIPVIASAIYPYRNMKETITGDKLLLAENKKEDWEKNILHFTQNKENPIWKEIQKKRLSQFSSWTNLLNSIPTNSKLNPGVYLIYLFTHLYRLLKKWK